MFLTKRKIIFVVSSLIINILISLLLPSVTVNSTMVFQEPAGAVLALKSYNHPLLPQVKPNVGIPIINAKSYIIIDNATNSQLAANNPHLRIYPASVTKLATVITALNIYPLQEIVTVPQAYPVGQSMNLKAGEKISIQSLVSGLLVYSANDAAFNLAAHYPGGTAGFVGQMNELAAKYNLKDTHFVNFDGIHNENHYSSVYDLSQLARMAIKNDLVRQLADTKALTVYNTDKTISHQLTTTNELLGVIPEVKGLKTGWTPEAGGSFVCLFDISGHEVISVVAQSDDRFGDTKQLINWVKANINWNTYFDSTESATAGS